MLRTIILSAFVLFTFVKHAHAEITATAKPTFVDSACIATASNTATTNLSVSNKRLESPTFFDLKVQIQKNLSKFFSTRIVAINSSGVCQNPLSDSTCTVVEYKNPDGTPVTVDGIYQFVVYSSLYNYIDGTTLDSGQLETVRAEFMKGYSGIDKRTFEVIIKENIASLGITSGLGNKSIADILALMDSASTGIAEKMSADGLFLQKLGYSSLVAFPITSRLIECLDGTFRNLFMKDISTKMHRTPFGVAQDYFKPAVILALILYFIAYGYKIVMAHGMGKQSEILMFAIKFALVFYFSIGEAWKDFAFDMLKSIPATVSQIVFEALPGSVDGCTAFKPSMYPQGKGMLSFFDTIDCKYANYIGLSAGESVPGIFSVITLPMLIPVPVVGALVSSLALLYLGMITFGILVGIEVYISSILFLTFYLFLAPLVVPMALFSKTEDICKKYQTKIIGTVVQAVMAVIMIVTIIGLMDGIIYGPNPLNQKLFTQASKSVVNGVPQPNKLNDGCYPNSTAGVATTDGVMGGAVPMACLLAKISPPSWYSFPVPYILEIFSLPVSSSYFTMTYSFIVPGVLTVISLLILQTVTGQITGIIEKISGATNTSSFGAASFNGGAKAIELAKNTASEAKATASAAADVAKAGYNAIKGG